MSASEMASGPDLPSGGEPPPGPPSSAPSETAATPAAAATPAGSSPAGRPGRWLWAWALIAGLVAGAVSWQAGESLRNYYVPRYELAKSQYDMETLRREKSFADRGNAAIVFGFLGGATGAALGLAGGLGRRSPLRGMLACVVGCILGIVTGAGVSWLLVPVFDRYLDHASPSLALPLLCHGAIWMALGAAGGLALGLGFGRALAMIAGLFGGTLGGALAALVFEPAVAIGFPTLRVETLIPDEKAARLLAHLSVALLVAAGATWFVLAGPSRRPVRTGGPVPEV